MEPRDIITDKSIYHIGDVIKSKVKFVCGILDPGLVDWAVYLSKDNHIWTQTCKVSHPWGDCGLSGGYVWLDGCTSDGIPVTSDMVGANYIGVANCIFPCADTIDSSADPNAIIASHPFTVKQPYPTGYGGITVVTEPVGAVVTFDGIIAGNSPINDYQIIMGSHDIKVSLPGYADARETVYVQDGQQVVRSYKLGTGNWWDPLIDYAPYIIGGAAGVAALVIIMKARQRKLERMRYR